MSDAERQLRESLSRWGRQPTPVVDADVRKQRARDGTAVLRGTIRRAHRDAVRQWRLKRALVWGAAAAAAVCTLWAGAQWADLSLEEPHFMATVQAGSRSAVGHGRVFREGKHLPLSVLTELRVGDRVEARRGGAHLAFGGATVVELESGSALSLRRLRGSSQTLDLHSGKGAFEVLPERTERVSIHTRDAEVVVTGTRFSVTTSDREDEAWTTVAVSRGSVEVHHEQRRIVLEAGQTWTSRPFSADRRDVKQSAQVGDVAGEDGPTASPDSTSGEAARDVTTEPAMKTPPTSKKTNDATQPGPTASEASPSNGKDGASTPEPSPATTLAKENQLFRSALSARNRGDDARAVDLLRRFLLEYPRSALRQQAVVERFRALARLGRNLEADRAASKYLANYPRGFAREEARKLILSQ